MAIVMCTRITISNNKRSAVEQAAFVGKKSAAFDNESGTLFLQ
jgi:hypothetical protein